MKLNFSININVKHLWFQKPSSEMKDRMDTDAMHRPFNWLSVTNNSLKSLLRSLLQKNIQVILISEQHYATVLHLQQCVIQLSDSQGVFPSVVIVVVLFLSFFLYCVLLSFLMLLFLLLLLLLLQNVFQRRVLTPNSSG